MAATEKRQAASTFTKERLVKSDKYMRYADFLKGNLQEDRLYTFEEVDALITNFYGKG